MDPRLLRYYNDELRHLREMGAEFAQQFPRIAARLRMDGIEVADPYVERLLEGFAFLAARVQLKIDAEFPRFTQRLLEIVYPNFLAPTPAMLIAQLQPELADAGLAKGSTIPRGSLLKGAARGGSAPCRFRTGQDVTLWPLEIAEAAYFTHATQLPLQSLPEWRKYGGGLRLKLRTSGGLDFSQLALQDLRLYCSGVDDIAYRLHELICGHALGAIVLPGQRKAAGAADAFRTLDADAIRTVGFDAEHAMLPSALPGFDGYRLVQEYFAFPQRFLFFDLCDLGPALRELGGQEAEVVLLFSRGDGGLQQAVDASSFALHCVPAINLFEQRCDRIHVTPQTHDFHVVVDRAKPMDFEVHQVLEVTGFGIGQSSERRFMPFYAAFHHEAHDHDAYFSLQREPRLMSTAQQRDGPRSSYIGSEVFLTIVDAREAPYSASLQQLGVKALCSNRDLPLLMPTGQPGGDLALEGTAPLKSIRILKGPSRPLSALREGQRGVALRQPAVAEPPVAARRRRRTGRRGAARDAQAARARSRFGAAQADRRAAFGAHRSRGAPAAAAGADRVRPRRAHRARGRRARVPGRQRVPARLRARTLLRAARVDERVHRNPHALADPRRDPDREAHVRDAADPVAGAPPGAAVASQAAPADAGPPAAASSGRCPRRRRPLPRRPPARKSSTRRWRASRGSSTSSTRCA